MTVAAKGRGPAIGIAIALLMIISRTAAGQGDASRDAIGCRYSECALSIAPAWNGLAIVRGTAGRRVANLNFFLPRDVTPALRGDPTAVGADSALAHAERAFALRRAAAVLTDVGAVAVVAALVHAASAGRADRNDKVAGGAGLASLIVSVPIQFAADGALSRAVWWHNLRYAR
jgi:hypothetical protein